MADETTSQVTADEVVITRVIDATRDRVWRAWTDPERFKRWWGPGAFTSPESQIDLRVGGKYLSCMRSPEGQDIWSTGEYQEIVPMERLVYTDSFADAEGNVVPSSYYGMEGVPLQMLVTVLLEDAPDGKTKMTLRHAGISGMPEQDRKNMDQGWRESFDKLNHTLTHELLFSRVIDAPRQRVWQAWTDPQAIVQWWGPNGFTTTIHEMDVRPGGVWRFVMHGPDGTDYRDKVTYKELAEPEYMVFLHDGDDEDNLEQVSHEMTVTFAADGSQTKVTMLLAFVSAEDLERVVRENGAIEGAKQTLQHLADFVTKE